MSEKPTWTLLLIDPQTMSRATLKRQLEYYGYAVREADSGRAGLQLFQEHSREIDLTILDMGISDAPGAKVLEVLNKLNPNIKTLLITDQSATEGREVPPGVVGVIKKPVRTDRLLALVGKGLGRN
ncbi:MAG: DNA-binding NtrC family response regulator [Candidatus Latescibacterota bacterium]